MKLDARKGPSLALGCVQTYASRALHWTFSGMFLLPRRKRIYLYGIVGRTVPCSITTPGWWLAQADNYLVDHNPDLQASPPTRDTANMSLCMNLHKHGLNVAEATKLRGLRRMMHRAQYPVYSLYDPWDSTIWSNPCL